MGYLGEEPQQNQQNEDLGNEENSLTQLFNDIQAKHEQPKSEKEDIARQAAQYGARALETLAGLPGNLKKAFTQTRDMLAESLKDFIPKEVGSIQDINKAFGVPAEKSWENLFFNPPTSSELRKEVTPKIAEAAGKESQFFEPQSDWERFAGDFTQDLISSFIGPSQANLAVRIGAPVVGNLVKEGLKYFGAEEETAEKAKLGTMLATSLAGMSNPGKFASERIGQAKNLVPDTATVHVGGLANNLLPLYNRLTRGLNVPSKSRALQGMRELADQVQNNRLNFRSLLDSRDNINEWIAEAGGWDIPGPIRRETLRNLNELKSGVIRSINDNMHRFPQAEALYRSGYEASAVNHQSNAISNFIEQNFGKKATSIGAKLLFPGIVGGAAFLPKTAAVGAASYPLYKTGQVLYRVAKSPTLAGYYANVIRGSMSQNIPLMVKSLDRLDKELAKEEKKDKPTVEDFISEITGSQR